MYVGPRLCDIRGCGRHACDITPTDLAFCPVHLDVYLAAWMDATRRPRPVPAAHPET